MLLSAVVQGEVEQHKAGGRGVGWEGKRKLSKAIKMEEKNISDCQQMLGLKSRFTLCFLWKTQMLSSVCGTDKK